MPLFNALSAADVSVIRNTVSPMASSASGTSSHHLSPQGSVGNFTPVQSPPATSRYDTETLSVPGRVTPLDETGGMAFGQQSGPPATAKQVQQLLSLLQAAGHSDFRDARGPLGFTQRQAAGKFSRDEADAFIETLEAEAELDAGAPDGRSADATEAPATDERSGASPGRVHPAAGAAARTVAGNRERPAVAQRGARASTSDAVLRRIPTEELAAELQRRGWVVMEPD